MSDSQRNPTAVLISAINKIVAEIVAFRPHQNLCKSQKKKKTQSTQLTRSQTVKLKKNCHAKNSKKRISTVLLIW